RRRHTRSKRDWSSDVCFPISSFTPSSGPVGTSVTIGGTNFMGATAVTFNESAASFTVTSDTAIQTTVPAGATTGPLSVTTPAGRSEERRVGKERRARGEEGGE